MVKINYAVEKKSATVEIRRRNFKSISPAVFEAALLSSWDWAGIYQLTDVNDVVKYLNNGLRAALDIVAPLRAIRVRKGNNVYLAPDTIEVMRLRDNANGSTYRQLRNRASVLVRRDKQRSNMTVLKEAKAKGDSRTLWQLANSAIGKPQPTLPNAIGIADGSKIMTVGPVAAANRMNQYYIDKVLKLRERNIGCKPPSTAWPKKTSRFEFTFCNSFGISKIIRALGNTAAVGNDHVPISVYKNGVNVLAGPVSHLVNCSLSSGKVPESFKEGIIIPVYKGHGKNRAQASSYRPVSLLPAVSKVLEVVLKESLEKHLAKLNAIPCSQFGFRRGRSCTMALATAQGEWLKAVEAGSIVGVLAFDLSAAFDTLDPAVLLPKLEALGILGRPLTWFTSYLNGGSQIVDWAGSRSSAASAKFGV
jgi:hypothetical protein